MTTNNYRRPQGCSQEGSKTEGEMNCEEIVANLRALSDPAAVAGMARFGISPENTLGVSIPKLRKLAKASGKNHHLAQELWATGIHEARILASMVDVPGAVTEEQVEAWAGDLDSWDVCDQCCNNLFRKTGFAHRKAIEWARREEEFVKRAGFVLMACLAVHDKEADDDRFQPFFSLIQREAGDPRNFVKKAVNWSLRQIGKRNARLNREAIALARAIQDQGPGPAQWVAADALRELTGAAVQNRLRRT
jgi:3-methyladenine DNA glycosylase AlkD